MKVNKIYSPLEIEKKWYDHWMKENYFSSIPDERTPYTIVIPPPNVTGVLHMGHMLNNTIQDILVRKARMNGFNTCWVPGTDHASIATEAKVVKNLEKQGIKKENISRDEFLNHAYEWKDKHGSIILEQLKKIGASCDWNRTKFTMDSDMNDSVIEVFIKLYERGLIYRGIRMINWDTSAQTAVSDEEVIYKEVDSFLFYISYNIENSDENIIIATTRPETILGDTGICVNPKDNRFKHLKGKNAIVPLINRAIPIIFDNYVDMDFGSGALKITPAHDINDYEIGLKHNLDSINILNDNGTLNKNSKIYTGKDRFKVREMIEKDLKRSGNLIKKENYKNKVGFSERTNTVIEPKLSMQWFCKMKELSLPALKSVKSKKIKFHPEKYINTYKYWMENIKDWCISRQLWWGQQIPAYYFKGNEFVIAKNKKEAFKKIKKKYANIKYEDINQDEDVLDTWFSSWLWPISVFDGIRNPNNNEIKYYYPTNDLVTAPEILFFWVARMIMAGHEYKAEVPFKNVYLTGIVRDKKGRKMSKSLGNSPDPLKLIEKYSADGVRVGMLLCSPAGNDLPFDESLCIQGRNFANKIWNAYRLIEGWEVNNINQPIASKKAVEWIECKINLAIKEINLSFEKYRISEALMTTYKLIWDDFCSWYLEIIKPDFGKSIDLKTYNYTIQKLDTLLKILHPFMPFISEEIWHLTKKRNIDLIISKWPEEKNYNLKILSDFEIIKEVVSLIRNFKIEKNITSKQKISLYIKNSKSSNIELDCIINKLSNLENLDYIDKKVSNSFSFIVKHNEYFIPFSEDIDIEPEIKKTEKELNYLIGFQKSVEGKLNNKKFLNNAPENIIENEKNKLRDIKEKIKLLDKKIKELNKS